MRESELSCSPNSPFLVGSSETWLPDLSLCPTTSAGSEAASVSSALLVTRMPRTPEQQDPGGPTVHFSTYCASSTLAFPDSFIPFPHFPVSA